jgi:hypothetical protein
MSAVGVKYINPEYWVHRPPDRKSRPLAEALVALVLMLMGGALLGAMILGIGAEIRFSRAWLA